MKAANRGRRSGSTESEIRGGTSDRDDDDVPDTEDRSFLPIIPNNPRSTDRLDGMPSDDVADVGGHVAGDFGDTNGTTSVHDLRVNGGPDQTWTTEDKPQKLHSTRKKSPESRHLLPEMKATSVGPDYGSFHRLTEDDGVLRGPRNPAADPFVAGTPKGAGAGAGRHFPRSAPLPSAKRPQTVAGAAARSRREKGGSVSCPVLPGGDFFPRGSHRALDFDDIQSDASGMSGGSSSTDVVPNQPLLPNDFRLRSQQRDPAVGGSAAPVAADADAEAEAHSGSQDAGGKPHRQLLISDGTSNSFFSAKSSDARGRGDFTVVDINSPDGSDRPDIPKDRLKTLVAMVFFGVCALVNMISLAIIHDQVPPREKGALPDIVLDHIYTNDWALYVSEYLLMVLTYFSVILCFFHVHRWVVFRRCFFLLGLLYLYRSVTMFVTVLPVASPTYVCNPQSNQTTVLVVLRRTGELLLGMGLSVNGYHRYCGDYIYSGHTMILVMGALVVREYTPRTFWPLHWFTYLWSAAGIFMILFSRGHYTVDVVIAYYITTRLFWIYHTLAHTLFPMKLDPEINLLGRSWWYPFFSWMERNVGGALPHSYESPIPFTKCLQWTRRRCRRQREPL